MTLSTTPAPAASQAIDIVDQRSAAADEALILAFAPVPGGTRAELVLSSGRPAHALLDDFTIAWHDLRAGDIVWVRPSGEPTPPAPR